MDRSSADLVKEALGGSIRAAARLISMVENDHPEAESALGIMRERRMGP